MSNNIKISVIMPSLNVGKYIEECILSVINQTLKEIEIICIDAESTDGTVDILKKYAKTDSRISLLNSEKKSYGHQVNIGLMHAKGEYISIVETDDFLDENMLKTLYDLSENGEIDLIKSTFYHYNDYDKDNIIANIDDFKKDLPDSEKFTLIENSLFIEGHPSVWAGIYNRNFLEKNKIKMIEAPGGGWVDNPFFFETAIAAKSIVYTHQPLYYYRVSNPNSSSNKFNDFTMPMDRILDMFNILNKYDYNDEAVTVRFYNRLFRYIEIILENNNNSDKDLDYETCLKIHETVKKVDEKIVFDKLKFNFQKIYYKYASPLFLARFNKPNKLTDEDYDFLLRENEFLHSNVAYFRTHYVETSYQMTQLKKKYNETEKLLNFERFSLPKKAKIGKKSKHISSFEIKNNGEKTFKYGKHESEYPLSVIMPVFNSSKFLKRSITSLLNQTLDNFEIVFIDDGSTDDSLKILRGYEKEHDFITVLTQRNSGSGKARNYGIKEAKGDYIAFLDADDFYIDEDALEKMYELAVLNDANMVTANIKHDLDKKGEFVPFGPFIYYTSNDVILPEQYGIPWSFYKNIFKKDFLIENNIYFPDLLRGQDPVFLAKALIKVDKIYVAATDLYAYVYNSDTAKASNPKKLYDQLLHYKQVIDCLNLPNFSSCRDEYFVKIMLFCSRLSEDNIVYAIESIRSIFKDLPNFLRRLENYISLKFKHLPKVNELIQGPKISVIMEVHNSEEFFEKTMNSLINQTMNDFELILIGGIENKFDYIRDLLENECWVKFIESNEKDIRTLRKIAFNESKGDYIYFCEDTYIFENNLFEDFLETTLLNDSEICLCNLPEGGANNNPELKFNTFLGNHNFLAYSCEWQKIIPLIFSSSFEQGFVFYEKSHLEKVFANDDSIDNSILQLMSILNSSRLSFVNKFLFEYLTKDNIYYSSKLPLANDNPLDIFNICDAVENYLREKSLYDDLKTYFDIYKINQISSYLDSVSYIGCYSYNDPKNRDLYANNDKVLDYSQYYGSKSEHVGLDYTYANEYFNKAKKEFDELNYRDLRFDDLKSNIFSDNTNLKKYEAVLKSNSFKEYKNMVNFSRVEHLRNENILLKKQIENSKLRKEELIESYKQTLNDNNPLKYELKVELNEVVAENKRLTTENNQLRDEYWKRRKMYDYILSSRSWQYTRWMRKQ